MRISNAHRSPNFTSEEIPVRFVVLHYTAADLKNTLEIFEDPHRGVCAHFVLDLDGTVYDLDHALDGPVHRGAHAGVSKVELDGETFESLNQMAIGIEIINFNGNLFPYTDAQYAALTELLLRLIARFPELNQPGRILGHEHVAGFRGKCDPGVKFDWDRTLRGVGLTPQPIHGCPACTAEDLLVLHTMADQEKNPTSEFWSRLSTQIEQRIKDHRPADCARDESN